MTAQGATGVGGAIEAAALEFGDDVIHERLEPARQYGRHDVEAIGRTALEALL